MLWKFFWYTELFSVLCGIKINYSVLAVNTVNLFCDLSFVSYKVVYAVKHHDSNVHFN